MYINNFVDVYSASTIMIFLYTQVIDYTLNITAVSGFYKRKHFLVRSRTLNITAVSGFY